MRKLRAIWQLIKADKWALFTYENAPEDPVWATFPFFRWNISEKCDTILSTINLVNICFIKYNMVILRL